MAQSGFSSFLKAVAKDEVRRQRIAAQELASAEREKARNARLYVASQKESAREAKQRHFDEQVAKATEQNTVLTSRLEKLTHLLEASLLVDDRIPFYSLRLSTEYPPFAPPAELTCKSVPPNRDEYAPRVTEPKGLARFMPGAQKRYEEALLDAEQRFEYAKNTYQATERAKQTTLARLQAEYDQAKQATLEKARQRNQEVDELVTALIHGFPCPRW